MQTLSYSFSLSLKRFRREWRQLAILLGAICLVTGFFALGPIYSRTMIQSGLQYQVAAANPDTLRLTFISNSAFKPDAWTLAADQLGALNGGLLREIRTQTAFGGFQYLYGEPTGENTPRSQFGNRIYAFSNLHDILKLTAGRWPDRLAPPDSPDRNATSEQERIDKGLGIYSRGEVEGVITSAVAKRTKYELGTRVAVGETPANRVVINIVGIVEAVDPNDPIWQSNAEALTGELLGTPLRGQSFNASIFVTEGAYTDWLTNATRTGNTDNNTYLWQFKLNTQAMNADNMDDVQRRLLFLGNRMAASYNGLITFNPLLNLINNYKSRLANVEGPVLLLSSVALILMLYHLVATAGLALERQAGEWASMASRGASTFQLVVLQIQAMILPAVLGFIAGPLLAALVIAILTRLSLLSGSSGQLAPLNGIPPTSFILSALAALAAIIMLSLPAIPAARRSLSSFKQIIARPPLRPAWARYLIDFILIIAGLGFIARLLFFVAGNVQQALSLLVNHPRDLIQLILQSANQAGGLSDPLNLLGPALLLTGIALLWLRLFPLLMRLISSIIGRGNRLIGPLATWNVARDPGRYAQLVLLLIGTLTLGTAALTLDATRDFGAWTQARQETGGALRVDFDGTTAPPESAQWLKLPGVVNMSSLTRLTTEYRVGEIQTFLAGVDPAQIAQTFPETASVVNLLTQKSANGPVPVVMSQRMAQDEGNETRRDRLPLNIGAQGSLDFQIPGGTAHLDYVVVGIVPAFPTLGSDQHFLIMDRSAEPQFASVISNQIWLDLATRQPDPALEPAIKQMPGITTITAAWPRYNELLYEPLPAAIDGMLFAGFWVSLILSLLDFGYYLVVTAQRRSVGFAVLQALGWNLNNIAALLAAEQAALTIPALVVGVLLGVVLAYVILPFLALAGGETLKLPVITLILLPGVLLIGFGLLLAGAAWWLRRLTINRVLRLGEE